HDDAAPLSTRRYERDAMRRSDERGPEEMVDASVHENVVGPAAPLPLEDACDIPAHLRGEEAPRLEDEARRREETLGGDAPGNAPEAVSERREVERSLSIRVRHAEAAAEVHGPERHVVPPGEGEGELEDALGVLDEEFRVEDVGGVEDLEAREPEVPK